MKKPASLSTLQTPSTPVSGCPFCRECHCAKDGKPAPVRGSLRDPRYVQVRRQGIYLAACIVDEVAALGAETPQAVIDEIRRRICELVRIELNGEQRS
jgi:hypothetical protein